jgi:hypothetical protein
MRYRDFQVQLRSAAEGFRICVLSSPEGEGEEPLPHERLPQEWSRESPHYVLRDLAPVSAGAPGLTPREIGEKLYSALFRGEVGNLFERSLAQTRAEGCGLRLQLILNPQDTAVRSLQSLPWELLFRKESGRNGKFLSLSAWTPIVRSLIVQQPGRDPKLPGRFRVLAAQALPREATVLRLSQELKEMAAAKSHDHLEVVSCRARLTELRETLDEGGPFHVLHYLGHAESSKDEGVLLFERPDGSAERVNATNLAEKLRDFTKLRLLVLNACRTARSTASSEGNPFGSVAAALVSAGFPVVLAMQEVISDRAAITLSRTLYRKLALRQPIEKALAEARHAMYDLDPQRFEWAVPSLFVRISPPSLEKGELPEPESPQEEAWRLYEAGLASFWARDFPLARQKFRAALGRDPSQEQARLFDLLSFMILAAPQDAKELMELDYALQKLSAAKNPEVARLAKLALGILRFDTSEPRGVRAQGISSEELFAELAKERWTSLEKDLASRLRVSRDAKVYFNLRD